MEQVLTKAITYNNNSTVLFELLSCQPDAIWLDSCQPHSQQGRYDIISACPDHVVETFGRYSTITSEKKSYTSFRDPFDIANDLLEPLKKYRPSKEIKTPFVAGILGYFGYDLGRPYFEIDNSTKAESALPDMRIGRYLWGLVVDHSEKTAYLNFHPKCSMLLRETILKTFERFDLIKQNHQRSFTLEGPFQPKTLKIDYLEKIAKIQQYIVAGDCYQVNLAQHFSASYDGGIFTAYLALREKLPSPYAAFWSWGNSKGVMSLSPERFLQVRDGYAETKPIKGTTSRGVNDMQDYENAQLLLNSEKDLAENLMIVDLLRNDLSKNAELGTVSVPKLFALESFPNVHHLVSTVTSKLKSNVSPFKLLKDCFPGGSITGAPKQRAMQVIEELEPVKRNVYCGSIGYINADDTMDTNIAIRTVVADGQTLHCWGGGGITGDSDPSTEYQESLSKINTLLKTIEDL
ncbi:MAG: aminodeoxychorismate synthase, component I [Cellvibrionales bacterium TMED49]|nr:MAG: aminodeoxychorismate synthase, component I [Cellvibrionales bacterium TMED49]